MMKKIRIRKDKAWGIHPEPSLLFKIESFTIKLKKWLKLKQ